MFMRAEAFHNAHVDLSSHNRDPSEIMKRFAVPIILAAFSIELYLKCLVVLDKGAIPPKLHELDKLFDDLETGTQSEIEFLWAGHSAARNDADLTAYEARTGQQLPRDLHELLKLGGRSFERMLYAYENSHTESLFALSYYRWCCVAS